ncbi:hypothetical protein D1B32_17235 [Oceanobacillus profundus]|uniref:Uncharacterized protein n=1 Tax=Oceanobacillus profundus TaxID=372463 RepID=A0A417YCI7_9BACI|nr:hypothetical protein D1B32_17235 [Oceanobacillus profundus]
MELKKLHDYLKQVTQTQSIVLFFGRIQSIYTNLDNSYHRLFLIEFKQLANFMQAAWVFHEIRF